MSIRKDTGEPSAAVIREQQVRKRRARTQGSAHGLACEGLVLFPENSAIARLTLFTAMAGMLLKNRRVA